MITKYIQRHSVLARITHGVVAISCILLAITGLFVMITAWNNGVGSEFTIAMRWTHRLLAIPFILIPLLAIIISPKGFVHLFKNNIFGKWDADDRTFAMRFIPYLFAPGKVHMPPQREVKSLQRVADGTLLFAGVFAAISGMILWLNTGLLPDGEWAYHFSQSTLLTAKIVHDISFIVIIVFGLGHIYLGAGIFEPYHGTLNLMFGNGKIKEADAAYHWGYWANNELAIGKNVVEVKDGEKKRGDTASEGWEK